MSVLATLTIGAGVHALLGAGIFWAKEEPYKVQIFIATILKGLFAALLIAFSVQELESATMWAGAMFGLFYGLAFGVVVFLAKGANFKTTLYLLVASVMARQQLSCQSSSADSLPHTTRRSSS
jgi:hypothetical protein